ncbi:MAG TPA: PAS domain-containing protein [Candidatus Obscuribacterales bacterium]
MRILVVNDNPLDPDGVEKLLAGLRGTGVEVVQAADLEVGLELLRDSRIDAFLMVLSNPLSPQAAELTDNHPRGVASSARLADARDTVLPWLDLAGGIIDSMSTGVVACDKNWRVLVWNAAMESITGCPRRTVLGQVLLERFPALRDTREAKLV